MDTAQKFASIYYEDGLGAASYNLAKDEITSAISNAAGSAVGRTVLLQLTRGVVAGALGGPVGIGIAVGFAVRRGIIDKSSNKRRSKSYY